MTPIPPAWAMAIAILASVTVSMAEARIGMFSDMLRVTRVRMSVSDGITSDRPGRSRTSSKVSASRGLPLEFTAITNSSSPALRARSVPSMTGKKTRSAAKAGASRASRRPVLGWRRSISWPAAES
jgi:hypothetical protein